MAVIGLITDFGDRGMHYVAEMKGVALGINKKLNIVDITHTITPFSVIEASYVIGAVYHTFPKNSIFVVVVDPGVGSKRDIVLVKTINDYFFIGPDNGIFSTLNNRNLIEYAIRISDYEFFYEPFAEYLKILDDKLKLSNELGQTDPVIESINTGLAQVGRDESIPLYQQILPGSDMSATFHGRDIMMPVAAHVASGLDPFTLGDLKENISIIEFQEPEITDNKKFITAQIQYIDSYGNIITNIPALEFQFYLTQSESQLRLNYNEKSYPLVYSPIFDNRPPELYLLMNGSSGFLEICQNRGHAADNLSAKVESLFKIELLGSIIDVPFSFED